MGSNYDPYWSAGRRGRIVSVSAMADIPSRALPGAVWGPREAAAFFDGEGCTFVHWYRHFTRATIGISLSQDSPSMRTPPWVLQQFNAATGSLAKVFCTGKRYEGQLSREFTWYCRANGRNAMAILDQIIAHLGPVKQWQAQHALAVCMAVGMMKPPQKKGPKPKRIAQPSLFPVALSGAPEPWDASVEAYERAQLAMLGAASLPHGA
jgi:hypothetical protein